MVSINSSTRYSNNNVQNKKKSQQRNLNFGKNKIVYVCSPLASGFKKGLKDNQGKPLNNIKKYIRHNMKKAAAFAKKVFDKGDVPNLLHSYLPKHVDDTKPAERKRAMECCLITVKNSDALVYFGEPKGGMIQEIELAKKHDIPVFSAEQYLSMQPQKFDKLVESTQHYKSRH